MFSAQALASGLHFWDLPVDAARHGPALDAHLLLNLWIALGLLALAHLILLGGIVARRRTARPLHQVLVEYVPLAALTVLFAFLCIRAHSLWAAQRYTGAAPTAMQVEVTGRQFVWYFRYPGHDATFGKTKPSLIDAPGGNPLGIDPTDRHSADDIVSGQLVLPAGREVDLTILSQDVIHGFAVPQMRLKQNAVPGQPQHIHFTPMVPGSYAIMCTQVCGMGHYRMQATMRVLPPDDFDTWLHAREAVASEAQP